MTKKQTGVLMRKEREARGWTWNRAATESGLKADQIKGIEQASRAYTNDSLLALAKVYGYQQHFIKGATGSDDVRG
jgi:transcriptional regulator with XRE-family HTH domain